MVVLDVGGLSDGRPRVSEEDRYVERARDLAGEGQDVTLTGLAPVWLYLMVAHALEGRVRTLWFDAPDAGATVLIYSRGGPGLWPRGCERRSVQ